MKKQMTDWEPVEPLKKNDVFIDNTEVVPKKDRGKLLRVIRIEKTSASVHKIIYEKVRVIKFEKL